MGEGNKKLKLKSSKAADVKIKKHKNPSPVVDEVNHQKKKRKVLKDKEIDKVEILSNAIKESSDKDMEVKEKRRSKLRQIKKKGKKTQKPDVEDGDIYDHEVEASELQNVHRIEEANYRKKKRKVVKNKEVQKVVIQSIELKESSDGEIKAEDGQKSTLRQIKKKGEKTKKHEIEQVDGSDHEVEGSNLQNGKSKKVRKVKKDRLLPQNEDLLEDNEAQQDGVYEISSGDEDSSQGMKKWIMEYHQRRPGVKILQDRIDDFIISHEEQLEQERKEREARAAEGGWTVVVHQKGRKKTVESESGIAVGAAHAAVTDSIAKKKNNDVGLDFYRFQKREAQRSEIMMLQSKFEQDKKRIQQMRAARRFKPF